MEKRKAAATLFDKLRFIYPAIVDGIVQIAEELIQVAYSWQELTYDHLDRASKAYFTNNNPEEMLKLLQPIREIIKKTPETFLETSFLSQFGKIIQTADSWISEYQKTSDSRIMHQAWQYLSIVYNNLRPIITSMQTIQLVDSSPNLSLIKNSEVAVPGMHSYNNQFVKIVSFGETYSIINSKQRPKKIFINGNNGETYTFLLKAHEDTRLDERVMQLFGYINHLVYQSTLPLRLKLPIETYKVTPLSGEVGLIGWVPNCSTLFEIISEYRKVRNLPVEIEYLTVVNAAPNYEELPLKEKVEVFKKGLEINKGNDLREILLLNAKDSIKWIQRRSTYAASLAMTSMVGYILGLGDRHLCNIMMKNDTARLVHIDFSDCFEVAMMRENYAEKVPFRLTRILVNALEISKIEGTFRSCCENVLTLMRDNNEHILSLLEAFIYDPLIQWTSKPGKEETKARQIVERIEDKLSGNDFEKGKQYTVPQQVDALIHQATDVLNLCCMFKGWYPWW